MDHYSPHSTDHPEKYSGVWCVRMWFSSGSTFDRIFDDYDDARIFMNKMINKPSVEDAHLWEL
jgi:hypothetical protein